MKLNECEKGGKYFVRHVLVTEAIGRRLEALGVNEGTEITVLNKKGSGSVIVKVRGTRLAMGKKIAEGIEADKEKPTSVHGIEAGKEKPASVHGIADGRGGRG